MPVRRLSAPPRVIAICLLVVGIAAAAIAPAHAQTDTPGLPVQATPSVRRDVPVVLRNIGAVQAYQSVLVRARVDGTLDKVLFTEGQEVKAGDPLAEIDPRPYAAALQQAQAKRAADAAMLANALHDLSRTSNLTRNDFASRQQLDTQQATVAEDQANISGDDAAIATARLNLEFCSIVSPINGRVGLRLIDPGNLIHATDAQGIVSITMIHPIAMIFTLPQDNLPQVQEAMARGALKVMAYSSDDRTLLSEGKLLTIDNTIDAGTGTFRLKAEFANTDNRLWPGQFVNARLAVDTLHNVIAVPSVAVQHGPNGLYVYVIKPDSTAAMQPVDVRQDDGQTAVIASGLDDGVRVVTNGQSRLQSGSRVTVTPAAS